MRTLLMWLLILAGAWLLAVGLVIGGIWLIERLA
jgi:hypothetical protein